MFCYCPLYMLGTDCGGNFKILDNGVKDCSGCTVCHTPDAQKRIISKFELIRTKERQNRG